MKEISEELKNNLRKSRCGLKKVSWNSIYDSEDELLRDLFHEKVIVDNDAPHYKICRGYEYIKGFRNYYKKNGCLSEKQMTQLKRLASEIAYQIYCEGVTG